MGLLDAVDRQVAVLEEVEERHPPDLGADLGVEVVLELERPRALRRVGRIQGRVGVKLLQRGDDRRRVADGPAVDLEDRQRAPAAAGQPGRVEGMKARERRLAHVGHALVVERPARLLVEVRDLDVPEDGKLAHAGNTTARYF